MNSTALPLLKEMPKPTWDAACFIVEVALRPTAKEISRSISGPECTITSMPLNQGWENTMIERLKKYSRYSRGWDGYKAPAPSKKSIDLATDFMRALFDHDPKNLRPIGISPSVSGGIGVAHRRDKRETFVEFRNDGKIVSVFIKPNEKLRAMHVSDDSDDSLRELAVEIGNNL